MGSQHNPSARQRKCHLHQRGHAGRSGPAFGPSALRAPCYGPTRPASPLSACQRCCMGQCTRLGFATRRCSGVISPVLRRCQSVRCGADRVPARLRLVLNQPLPSARPGKPWCAWLVECSPASENDITPHCLQCAPVSRRAPLVAPTASAPFGCRQQALCQILPLESGRQPSALPGHCVPYAPPSVALVVCWHLGISQALRAVCLVSGLRPVILCVPRPPLGLACFAASAARSARPPPRGSLRTAPGSRRLRRRRTPPAPIYSANSSTTGGIAQVWR